MLYALVVVERVYLIPPLKIMGQGGGVNSLSVPGCDLRLEQLCPNGANVLLIL